ncbi:MAG TPA: hypothetical protein VN776_05160 [Terracidiphilus sp.]|nr:hypothetical protein [Terracidiphilus sp.]
MTLLDADQKPGSNEIGEDTWDLFAAVEESFGVDLGDYYELAGISVGDLADRISALANYPDEKACLSAVAFFRLRQAITEQFGFLRAAIHPATSLRGLLPWISRRSRWRLLEERLELKLPSLGWPGWVFGLALLLPASLLIAIGTHFGLRMSMQNLLWGVIVLFVLFLLTLRALLPLARALPTECETVGELAKVMLAKNYAAFAMKRGSSTERGVMTALRQLVALQAGLRLEDISTSMRIPADLDIY